MSVTFLGNQEYRHYVELGPAVTAVNAAEAFCQSGYVVMSPGAWSIASQDRYETQVMDDNKHIRVIKTNLFVTFTIFYNLKGTILN